MQAASKVRWAFGHFGWSWTILLLVARRSRRAGRSDSHKRAYVAFEGLLGPGNPLPRDACIGELIPQIQIEG